MSNSIGKKFEVTSFGESHGRCVGVVIDGCPAGLPVDTDEIHVELDRRMPRLSAGGTARIEEDEVDILSGMKDGFTTGAPVCAVVWNRNTDSDQYEKYRSILRPGHADYASFMKYNGFNDYRGGGRFSGRITAGFVIAGAFAKKLIGLIGVRVLAHTVEIGMVKARPYHYETIMKKARQNNLYCADAAAAAKMTALIDKARREGDSLGGIIECLAVHLPAGLGEPVFDNIDGELSKALFAIPAVKGVEFGAGFEAARLKGSQNNDPYTIKKGKIVTVSNNSGGVLGGISSGMPLVVRVAIKPTPSIGKKQKTVDISTRQEVDLEIKGRHDACIVPRAVVVVESMTSITLVDFAMRSGIIKGVIG
jgi:chorismate synthase